MKQHLFVSSFDAYYVEDDTRHLRFSIDRDERPDGIAAVPREDTWEVYAPAWARGRREEILAYVVPRLRERGFEIEVGGSLWSPTRWADGALPAEILESSG